MNWTRQGGLCMTRKNAANQRAGNLEAVSGEMLSLGSSDFNGHWQHKSRILETGFVGQVDIATKKINCAILCLFYEACFG